MKLNQKKYNFLRYVKDFCVSENYIVFCTGRTAFICNKELTVLNKIEKLSYVYNAEISPDEKYVLLISTGNRFYIVDLNDFSLQKQVIRGKYNGNLEGCGCWSFDGKSFYIPVLNSRTLNSTLRCYKNSDTLSYNDFYEEKYFITSISPVKVLNKYLLAGCHRPCNNDYDSSDYYHIIMWFDGNTSEVYPLIGTDFDAIKAEYDDSTNTVIIYGFGKTYRCDIYGKCLDVIMPPNEGKIEASFSDTFKAIIDDDKTFNAIKSLSNILGMENISVADTINKICTSSDKYKIYVGTHSGLFIIDAKTQTVLAKKTIDYGVQNIIELSPDLILISTWSGTKVFEII